MPEIVSAMNEVNRLLMERIVELQKENSRLTQFNEIRIVNDERPFIELLNNGELVCRYPVPPLSYGDTFTVSGGLSGTLARDHST